MTERDQLRAIEQQLAALREVGPCGHLKARTIRKWPLLDAVTTDDPERDYPDDVDCLDCAHEREAIKAFAERVLVALNGDGDWEERDYRLRQLAWQVTK